MACSWSPRMYSSGGSWNVEENLGEKKNDMEYGPLFHSMSHKVSIGLLYAYLIICFLDPMVPKLKDPKLI